MKIRRFRRQMPLMGVYVICASLQLSACEVSPKFDVHQSQLLPEAAAKKILAERVDQSWAEHPMLFAKSQSDGFRTSYSSISVTSRNGWLRLTAYGMGFRSCGIRLLGDEDERSLTTALVSLGARRTTTRGGDHLIMSLFDEAPPVCSGRSAGTEK